MLRHVRERVQALSLRQRFLVAPVLGLVLLALLGTAFVLESGRQSALLDRLAERDLAIFDRYARVFIALSEQHTAIHGLLSRAGKLTEEALYEQSKERLYAIARAAEDLAALMKDSADTGGLRTQALARTRAYRDAAINAVEMATVDLGQATGRLELASARFVEMNRALAALLQWQRDRARAEVSVAVRRAERSAEAIVVAGVVAAALLVALSIALSRLLAGSLQAQIRELTDLGVEAGAQLSRGDGHEVQRIARAIGAFRDALRRLRSAHDELELRVVERTRELRVYAEVIRSTGEAVAITAQDRRIIDVNAAFERAGGRPKGEVVGTPLYAAGTGPHPDGFYRDLWRTLESSGHWSGEILHRRSNGETYPTWATVNALRDEHGTATHYVSVSRDVSALKQAEQKLQRLAFYDSLTGLSNRALFNDRLDIALAGARRRGTPLVVMYIDLDRFKFVNDSLGHAAGDELLIEVAQRLKACVRTSDTVARMGGDEFTVLLTESGTEAEAVAVAQRIVDAVSQPVQLKGETVYVGASVGLSVYPRDGTDSAAIKKHADVAMYEAKQAGRGQYRMFDTAMLLRGGDRMSLSVRIDNALKNGEFRLVYQPIVDTATGRPDGVEALIRWPQADGTEIQPAQFIPHAEEAGLIRRIDQWVLETGCREAATWLGDGAAPLRLAINLSAVSLQQAGMAQLIEATLRATGLPARLLNIEITETAVIADPDTARKVLEHIAALGVTVSMDDFGTGYSTLNYLVHFPISCIKLDQSFIERIGKDRASEAVIGSLLQLGRKLNLRMVAEGVEDAEQKAFLKAAGCEFVQGFHLSHPLPAEQLQAWLTEARASMATAG